MKKKLSVLLAVSSVVVAGCLTACDDGTEKNSVAVDYNNIAIDGLDEVFLDKDTESFGLMDGVTATYSFKDNSVKTMTNELRVVLPEQATLTDGKVSFDECGDYGIVYYVNGKNGDHTVAVRTVKVRNVYNLYWMSATLPVMYCALDMVQNDYKSMLIFTRTDTIDIDALDKDRFLYVVNGAGDGHVAEAKRRFGKIAYNDPYSYFRFFTVDLRNQQEFFTFPLYNVSSDRYEVKLLSDGTATYTTEFPYRNDGDISRWNTNLAKYDKFTDLAIKGEYTVNNGEYTVVSDGVTYTSGIICDQCEQMSAMAAQRDNVEWWMAYPETLTSKNAKIQAEMKKAHTVKMQPDKIFANFTDEQKAEFLRIMNFDKPEFDETYFDKQGDYLIITGANPVYGSLSETQFISLLDEITEQYSGYNILFKPHPSAIPTETKYPNVYNYFAEKQITILPGKLPMEVISWCYPDVKMGGFDSSLYMSVPQGNVEFFICENKDNLSAISKQLYEDGAFGTPKFYWNTSV